jgi:hypothetical protein
MNRRAERSVAIRRARLLLPVLPLLLGVACDPQGPGSMGRLTASPVAHVEAGRTLEMRAFPDDGQPFDPATTNWSDQDWLLDRSWDLAEVEFPLAYEILGAMGYTDHQRWRLVAWIAGPEDINRPGKGEWYGTRLFNLDKCGMPFPGYCRVTYEVDIEIDQRY